MPTAVAFNILLIAALLCVTALLLLGSLRRSNIPGILEWSIANAAALAAFSLYAFDNDLLPFLSYEGANGAYAFAHVALYVGFCQFFSRKVPWLSLCIAMTIFIGTVTYFHYFYYSFALRTIVVSIFSGTTCLAVASTIFRSKTTWRVSYPYVLTAILAGTAALGHFLRGVVHGTIGTDMSSLLQAAPLNLVFITLGSIVLPAITMGAILMVHERLLAQAEHASEHDFLTGALSRRAFFAAAEKEIKRAARTKQKLAVLIFDVDHFKGINDRYGHGIGDQVLMNIAARVDHIKRASDCFARVGGEEFALLLPETDSSDAAAIAERVRHALDCQTEVVQESDALRIQPAYTVSIGFAVMNDAESFNDLMMRADAALYGAKAAGRNTVVLARSRLSV